MDGESVDFRLNVRAGSKNELWGGNGVFSVQGSKEAAEIEITSVANGVCRIFRLSQSAANRIARSATSGGASYVLAGESAAAVTQVAWACSE